jgi:hypothetical protein
MSQQDDFPLDASLNVLVKWSRARRACRLEAVLHQALVATDRTRELTPESQRGDGLESMRLAYVLTGYTASDETWRLALAHLALEDQLLLRSLYQEVRDKLTGAVERGHAEAKILTGVLMALDPLESVLGMLPHTTMPSPAVDEHPHTGPVMPDQISPPHDTASHTKRHSSSEGKTAGAGS